MNVKCPYCGCGYELGTDVLKNPIGNEKLGYGWWLRCYRCKRKWWLKNISVEIEMNPQIKVDKFAQIQRISALSKKNSALGAKHGLKVRKYIILLILIGVGILCYQYRTIFYDFLIEKAKHLSENVAGKLAMADVKYDISVGDMLTVTGNILNYDERTITKVNGVRISVFNDKSLILTWDNSFDDLRILPQQKVPFSVSKQLPQGMKNIRVEVSVF